MEDGFYMAKLVEATMCETQKGSPMLVLGWEIMDAGFEGTRVESQHFFTGGAKSISIETMKDCGWDESEDLLCMLGTTKSLQAKTDPEYGQQWRPWTKRTKPMDKSKARSFLASIAKPQSSPFAGKEPGDDMPF